jgi:hypothetical protein
MSDLTLLDLEIALFPNGEKPRTAADFKSLTGPLNALVDAYGGVRVHELLDELRTAMMAKMVADARAQLGFDH